MTRQISFMLVTVLLTIVICLSGLACITGDNGSGGITPKQKTQVATLWPTVIWPTSTPVRYD